MRSVGEIPLSLLEHDRYVVVRGVCADFTAARHARSKCEELPRVTYLGLLLERLLVFCVPGIGAEAGPASFWGPVRGCVGELVNECRC
jgi:hypothetical protein